MIIAPALPNNAFAAVPMVAGTRRAYILTNTEIQEPSP